MAAAKLFNMLFLLVFIGFVSALPGFGYGDSTSVECSTACQAFHSRCLDGVRGPEFCRDLVCEYYSNKCVGCPACLDSSAATFDFTPAVVDAGETAAAIVKREPQTDYPSPFCVFLCYHAGCRRKCFWDPNEAPEEIHDALVINEDAVNGTVSVKITEQTADDDSKQKCKHWVCVFRTYWYVPCHNGATEEIASVQTSATTGTSEPLASGCRKVCQNDSEDAICITICDPDEYDPDEPKVDDVVDDAFKADKAASGYRILDDVISYCEWKLMGHYLYQICYTKDPAKTLTTRQDVNSNNSNSKGELCSTVCWDGSLCFVYCGDSSEISGDSSEAAGDSSKRRDGNGDVELQKAALCESNCPSTSFLCIMMCRQGPKEKGS